MDDYSNCPKCSAPTENGLYKNNSLIEQMQKTKKLNETVKELSQKVAKLQSLISNQIY